MARAEEKVDQLQAELEDLERECEAEVEKLKAALNPRTEPLESIRLTPLKKNCDARAVGVVWMPYRIQSQPTLGAAW